MDREQQGEFIRHLRGVSVKWLKLSASLWCLAVRPARRNVTRECMNGFLDSLEWHEGKHIGGEEFAHILSEWLSSDEKEIKNEFTLTHLRTVLLEDRACFNEQSLAAWIRSLTKESYKRMLHKPICYTRGNISSNYGKGSSELSAASSSSASTGGKKSAPVNPSSFEVVTEEWSRLCKELFGMLDINKHFHWAFEEVLFFTSILSVAKARFLVNDREMDEEYVGATLALDKLSTRALDMQKSMGATFHVTSGGLGIRKGIAGGKASTKDKDAALPSTAYITEPMLAQFLLKRQIGASGLKSIVSLLKLVLKELRKLVSKEECAFDGLSQDLPALWHRSVTIASGFTLEKEPGYARYCQDPGSALEKPDKGKDEVHADRDEEESHQDDGEEDQSLLSSSKDGQPLLQNLRKSVLKLSSGSGAQSNNPTPLLGMCLFLIADACRLIPASLHVIDDSLHDLAFATEPADCVDRSEAEKQCAEEMRRTARRMIGAYNVWGEHLTPMPTVESLQMLRDRTGTTPSKSQVKTPPRSSSSSSSRGRSPMPAKSPARSGKGKNSLSTTAVANDDTAHSAVVSLYLGVLVEYKNLHLQLCDALVSLHDVLWAKIAHNLDRYPTQKCLDVLLPETAGEDILREITELYRPPTITPAPAPAPAPAAPLSAPMADTASAPASAPRLRRTREQAALRRQAELEARDLMARAEELRHEEARRDEHKKRAKARKAAQERARLVQQQEEEQGASLLLQQRTKPHHQHHQHQQQQQKREQAPPQKTLSAQSEQSKASREINTDKMMAIPSSDPRENDPDHIFWKLRSARSLEEKEALLAQLKFARYGDEEQDDNSNIAFYDHSPNPAQRELLLRGSADIADNAILANARRRASTTGLKPLNIPSPPPMGSGNGTPSRDLAALPLSPLTPDKDLSPASTPTHGGAPTSINDMIERGIDFDGAKYAKELRQRLRAMNCDTGITQVEAEELLAASERAVASAKKGSEGGSGSGQGQEQGEISVVSGTPSRRVPGLDKDRHTPSNRLPRPSLSDLL